MLVKSGQQLSSIGGGSESSGTVVTSFLASLSQTTTKKRATLGGGTSTYGDIEAAYMEMVFGVSVDGYGFHLLFFIIIRNKACSIATYPNVLI